MRRACTKVKSPSRGPRWPQFWSLRDCAKLHIAEDWYRRTGLEYILDLPAERINDDRLCRALDELLPHKETIEQHLRKRLGELFSIEYDVRYDVTSTYFEGLAEKNDLAKHGHSRDHRSDCKQVCIALVVTREGLPLGYEVFPGNRSDMTTVKEVVECMERRFGIAQRVWVMDRGMGSEANVKWPFTHHHDHRHVVEEFLVDPRDVKAAKRIGCGGSDKRGEAKWNGRGSIM